MHHKEKQIIEGLIRISKEHGPEMIFDGEVVEVDSENYLADVILDTGETIFECLLRALATGNQSIDVLPSIGSAVTIARITDNDFLVLAADQIDSYRITIGNRVLKLDADGLMVSHGTDTLKAVLSDLITQILQIYAVKNAAAITLIQQRLNAILQ